jgi:hypothetical protein
MKTNIIIAAIAMAATTTAKAQIVANDSIDNSADQQVIAEFLATGEEFDSKSNRAATYVDGTKAFAGNSGRPIMLDARMQRGFFIAPSFTIMATLGENSFVAPKLGVEGGYEGNKWGLYGALYYLKARPNEQSDLQGRFDALSAEFGVARSVCQWNDHHTRLVWRTDAIFQTTLDRQDLGSYETVDVQETETEIVTTRETGWRAYKVKPFMFGAKTGLELSHQLYKLPIAFYAGGNVGFISQIAGKESINGSNDGIGYKLTVEGRIGVRFYLHGKVKNQKAQNMISH